MNYPVKQNSELTHLLEAALRGENVILTQNGEAIAQVTALPKPKNTIRLGVFPKEIKSDLLEPTD
jgi:antitoxin (DNA-binding transcriptional repressor) of toxin-antitoxin stability system